MRSVWGRCEAALSSPPRHTKWTVGLCVSPHSLRFSTSPMGSARRHLSSLPTVVAPTHPSSLSEAKGSVEEGQRNTAGTEVNMSKERRLASFDFAMKNILRNKANYDVLEGFLTTLLGENITVDALLESESNEEERFESRVDISARDDKGNIYLIEVQAVWEPHCLKQILYRSSKLIANYMEGGNTYEEVKKVISISILYHDFSEEKNEYIHKGAISFKGVNAGQPMSLKRPDEELNVFPEYYIIETKRFHDDVKQDIDEWVYFFKNSKVKPDFHSKNIQVTAEKLDTLKMSKEKRHAYDKYEIDKASYIKHMEGIDKASHEKFVEGVKKGKEEGIEVGIEVGIKKGIEVGIKKGIEVGIKKGRIEGIKEGWKVAGWIEGRKKGIEEGRIEGIKEVAVNMLRGGLTRDQVVQLTGLPEEEIRKLSE